MERSLCLIHKREIKRDKERERESEPERERERHREIPETFGGLPGTFTVHRLKHPKNQKSLMFFCFFMFFRSEVRKSNQKP